VIQLTEQFVPVKINAEKEGVAVAKKYKVDGFPTILFINDAGEVEGKIGGYMPPAGFSEQLKSIAQGHKEAPLLEERLKKNPQDAEAAGKLAAIYAGRGKAERASELIAQAEKTDSDNSNDYLTKAYNALGDYYQENRDFDKAIPLFRKAATTGKKPSDIAYAHMSIAVCYLSQNKLEEAVPELKATIDLPGVSNEDKEQAEALLKRVEAAINQKQGNGQ